MNDELGKPTHPKELEAFDEKMLTQKAAQELEFTLNQELIAIRSNIVEAAKQLPESFEAVKRLITDFDIESEKIINEITDSDTHALAQIGQLLALAELYKDCGLGEAHIDALENVVITLENFAYAKKTERLMALSQELKTLAIKKQADFPDRESAW